MTLHNSPHSVSWFPRLSQCPVSAAVVRGERRVLAPIMANQRATEREREREMATLAAGRGSQQSVEIEPVAVLTLLTLLRNYTDWQHQLCHRTTSQHQHEDKNCSQHTQNTKHKQTFYVLQAFMISQAWNIQQLWQCWAAEGAWRRPEYKFN